MRISTDEYFMNVAKEAASRATCLHRSNGAVIVKDKRIVATGYNGSPPGQVHCIDLGYCNKTGRSPDQQYQGYCRADGLHAESNAILSCALNGISTKGATIYSVFSPCYTCCHTIMNAGITTVIFDQLYSTWPHGRDYLRVLDIDSYFLKEVTGG